MSNQMVDFLGQAAPCDSGPLDDNETVEASDALFARLEAEEADLAGEN